MSTLPRDQPWEKPRHREVVSLAQGHQLVFQTLSHQDSRASVHSTLSPRAFLSVAVLVPKAG